MTTRLAPDLADGAARGGAVGAGRSLVIVSDAPLLDERLSTLLVAVVAVIVWALRRLAGREEEERDV